MYAAQLKKHVSLILLAALFSSPFLFSFLFSFSLLFLSSPFIISFMISFSHVLSHPLSHPFFISFIFSFLPWNIGQNLLTSAGQLQLEFAESSAVRGGICVCFCMMHLACTRQLPSSPSSYLATFRSCSMKTSGAWCLSPSRIPVVTSQGIWTRRRMPSEAMHE